MTLRRGLFVTLEGGEGAGKSTLAGLLEAELAARQRTVVRTREPGGTAGADAIRALLVQGAAGRWSVLSEALLLAAARNDHLERVIRPGLANGAIVLCDRYLDSTWAYQVRAGGLDEEAFASLLRLIDAPAPDLTFVLDIDPRAGLARSHGGRVGEDRFENMDLEFHETVRSAFLEIARREPMRCVVLDATLAPDAVFAQARAALEARLI